MNLICDRKKPIFCATLNAINSCHFKKGSQDFLYQRIRGVKKAENVHEVTVRFWVDLWTFLNGALVAVNTCLCATFWSGPP